MQALKVQSNTIASVITNFNTIGNCILREFIFLSNFQIVTCALLIHIFLFSLTQFNLLIESIETYFFKYYS